MRRSILIWVLAACVLGACGGKKSDSGDGSGTNAPQGGAGAGTGAATLRASAELVLQNLVTTETAKDVTCWTSFRQLDWFIAEKSYSEFGTLAKIAAMKALVRAVWEKASQQAKGASLTAADIQAAVKLPALELPNVAASQPKFANDIGVKNFTDYQKTSEHSRLLLSVIQTEMYTTGGAPKTRPLDATAVKALTDAATTLSLMMLKESSAAATEAKSLTIEGPHVQAAHKKLAADLGLRNEPHKLEPLAPAAVEAEMRPITQKLIDNKVEALLKFNKGTGKMLDDLNKVARVPLTQDGLDRMFNDAKSFARFVATGIEPMQADNYLSDGNFANSKMPRRAYVDEVWAQNVVMQIFPHHMEPNSDVRVRYEPNPGPATGQNLKAFEVKMLGHEMDGVRDSAIHWRALQAVYKDMPFAMDAFAAEYVSEVVSMMITLWIRRGEAIAAQQGKKVIDAAVVKQVRGQDYVLVQPGEVASAAWTPERQKQKAEVLATVSVPLFKDVSKTAGLPTKLSKFGVDLDTMQGHVEPKLPGHVEPKLPGHVEPKLPGHVEPADTKKLPGHVDPQSTAGGFNLQTIMGGGIAVGDVNGDDYPDLFLGGEELGKLYLNQGKAGPGKFVDATAAWGLPADIDDAHGTLFFDFDGDGDLDLLVLRSEHNSALFRQDKGKFTDVATEMGLQTHRGAHVANVFDYDGDGDLDIYIGYYGAHESNMKPGASRSIPSLDGRNGSPNQLWRNDGGKFTEVALPAGVADVGWTLAVASFDADNDGDMDLFLANDFGADVFYRNNGDGTFADITVPTGTGDRGSGMNVDVADINGDGRWDIYVTNIDMFSKNIKVIFPRDESTINIDDTLTKAFQYLAGNKLYVTTKDGGYRAEENLRFEPKDRGWGWDASFFDYDNDGDDDLYVTNGWINGSYAGNQKKQMYLNHEGFFYLAPESSDEAFAGNARSAAPVDLDLDGDVDLVVNSFRQPPRVLLNQQKGTNHWIHVKLAGKGKNTQAIGAQVTIKAGAKTILRQVSGGRGYLGQTDTLVVAGTGAAKTVDLEIRWPDGTRTEHKGLAANQRHKIAQP
ncbi:MAG: CRTAC1 family protein [Deltaproteobacteria bacterium]|nr:CRTAC1 family protein [Deltaproteobacteria bacterium]